MKSSNQIERLVKNTRIKTSENVDNRILTDAKAAFLESTKTRLAAFQSAVSIWRIIMKSPISKLAVAAVVIIAVLIGINEFSGSVDMTGVAWADVVEQINNYTKYKCRQRVVWEQGPQIPAMDVYHMNLSLRRQEVENGDIHIIDMRGEDTITVELKPAEMKATVTKGIGGGPRKDPHIIEMVKQFEQESTERLGTKEVNGKILQGFRYVPNEANDFFG